MESLEEDVPTLPLQSRRRILGYIIPLMNIPLMFWKFYQMFMGLSSGNLQLDSIDFLTDLIIISFSLILILLVPSYSPIYSSSYWFTLNGLKIKRFMKSTKVLSYDSIKRVDLYLRDDKKGEPNQDAIKYSRESIDELRRAGFKFQDFTNDERKIALLFSNDKIYMITPAYPKAFVQKLQKRIKNLKIRTVELTSKGKRVKEGLT